MDTEKQINFTKREVFDSNLLPYPFDRIKVIKRDIMMEPTEIDFFDKVIIKDDGNFTGRKVFTLYIKRNDMGLWYDAAVKKYI